VPACAPAPAPVTCALRGPLHTIRAVSGPAAPEHTGLSMGLVQRIGRGTSSWVCTLTLTPCQVVLLPFGEDKGGPEEWAEYTGAGLAEPGGGGAPAGMRRSRGAAGRPVMHAAMAPTPRRVQQSTQRLVQGRRVLQGGKD
jgi:hypothetical protein